jgi:signal transduction histidine kinase
LPLRILSGIDRHREVILAATFLVLVAYELLEMLVLEVPRVSAAGLFIHSVQIVVILAATFAVLRAWREKTAREEALARMIEQVVVAQEAERQRIAYDIHDGLAPLIVSAKHHVDTGAELWAADPAGGAREVTTGLARLERAVIETRRVLHALRPSALDGVGFAAAVGDLLRDAERDEGWAVTMENELCDDELPSAVEAAAFRIVQEAVLNIRRHARASAVGVALRRDSGWLAIEVRDDGVGIPGAGRGLGLSSMKERARLLGGVCTIDAAPPRGTRVSARLPLRSPMRAW